MECAISNPDENGCKGEGRYGERRGDIFIHKVLKSMCCCCMYFVHSDAGFISARMHAHQMFILPSPRMQDAPRILISPLHDSCLATPYPSLQSTSRLSMPPILNAIPHPLPHAQLRPGLLARLSYPHVHVPRARKSSPRASSSSITVNTMTRARLSGSGYPAAGLVLAGQ